METAHLAAAMVKAQSEMPKVKATGRNPHFGNEYVTLDDLLAAVLPVLNRHGLALMQFPISSLEDRPLLLTVLMHESGDKVEHTMPLLVGKQDMQGLGSAITYARRYALAACLGIAEGEDDDGNRAAAAASNQNAALPQATAATTEAWTASAPQKRLIVVVDDLIGKGNLTEQQVQSAAGTTESWPRLVRALDDGAAAGLAERLERFRENLRNEERIPVGGSPTEPPAA